MRAAGTELAAANARALVSDWIAAHGRRISGVGPGAGDHRQAHHRLAAAFLRRAAGRRISLLPRLPASRWRSRSAICARWSREMPDGEARLRARIALAFAALSLPTPPSRCAAPRAISPTSSTARSSPTAATFRAIRCAILELLADLLPLRQTYANQAEAPPAALISAIDRMLPALRFFRHQDGSLARFNGMGVDHPRAHRRHPAPRRHRRRAAAACAAFGLSSACRPAARPSSPIPACRRRSTVSGVAHAGCLSFELSSAQPAFHRQCRRRHLRRGGVPAARPRHGRAFDRHGQRHLVRALQPSAARQRLSARRWSAARAHVPCERTDQPGVQGFVASHDGYVPRFGLFHERELQLSADGDVLSGADRFLRRRRRGRATMAATRHRPLPSPSRRRAVPRRQGPHRAGRAAGRPLDVPRRRGAEVEESIFFAGARRPAPQPPDRAALRGLGIPSALDFVRRRRRPGGLISRRRCGTAATHPDRLSKGLARMAVASKNIAAPDLVPVRTGAAVGLRQDRPCRLCPRARAIAASSWSRPAARASAIAEAGLAVRDVSDLTGFPGDHGRARQDAASQRPWRPAGGARRSRARGGDARSTASRRSICRGQSLSVRGGAPLAAPTMPRSSRTSISAARPWSAPRPRTTPMSPSSPIRPTMPPFSTRWS